MKQLYLRLLCTALIGLYAGNLFAQVPPGYYDTATGTGYALKTQLKNIIDGHTVVTYGDLHNYYDNTDADLYYENDGTLLDMYSENPAGTDPYNYTHGVKKCGNYSVEGDCYNREHSVPSSWFGGASPMYTDIFHVVPTDGKVNGTRSSFPFGEVGTATNTSQNGSQLGSARAGLGYTGTVFEPIDEFKGDFARIYFYMATRYEDQVASWNSPMFDGSSDKVFTDWALDMLISWHEADPVSQFEIDRNNAVYNLVQGNRNPFVDNPGYVASIWGSSCTGEPTTVPSGVTASSTTDTQTSISLTPGNGGSRIILVSTSAITFEPIDGTDYSASANSDFSAGTAQSDGSKIVYAGANAGVTVTGLNPSTSYNIEVFEYCSVGFDYNNTEAVGSFTTSATPPANPTLAASAQSSSEIELAFGLNGNSDNIVIAFNTTGSFTSPTDGAAPPSTGSAFAGGNILYQGNASGSPFSHTGLAQGQTYYYRAFSVDASNVYSTGVSANATTTALLPLSQAFSNCADLDGWFAESVAGSQTWSCENGYMDINTFGNGNNEDYLISPPMDFSSLTNAAEISFLTQERYEGPNLELLYSTDYAGNASTATWNAIPHTFADTSPDATFSNFVSSGTITLPSISSNNVRIAFRYTATGNPGSTEHWRVDDIVIQEGTTAGTTANPANFTAGTSVQANTLGLGFTPNASSDDVVIVYNATGTFGTPSGTPSVGASLAGGDVLYIGTGNSFTHSGLSSGTTYYYKAFSYNSATGYSAGIEDAATTSYGLNYDVYATSFDSDPTANGWTAFNVTGGQAWGYVSGTGMQMNALDAGVCQANEDWLISPPLDLSATAGEELSFDLAENFDGTTLEVLYSTDYDGNADPNTANWTSIGSYTATSSVTANASLSALNDPSVYVAFKYVYSGGSCSEWTLNSFSVVAGAAACSHSISGLSIASGPVKTDFTITGSGFTGNGGITYLAMGGQPVAGYTVVSDTEIKLEVPVGATSGEIEIIVDGCSVTNNGFTLIEGSCTGVPPTASGLFISEYVEGGGSNKAIEIFNGTGASVDLNAENYSLAFYFNGSTSAGTTISLTGTVSDGDVYIVYDDNSASGITSVGDQSSNSSFFNGDDAIVLFKDGVIVDAFGKVGEDPGSAWSSGGVDTQNNTLIRNSDIIQGDTNDSDDFFVDAEWTSLPQDDFSNLGSHTFNPPAGTPPSGPAITTQPVDAAVCPGGASFSVATSEASPTYQWKVYEEGGGTVTPASDLFISEYLEGGGNDKYLEVANNTGSPVNLSSYTIVKYSNGSSTPDASVANLSGTLNDGEVYILANTSASIAGVTPDQTMGQPIDFNGNDAIALRKSGTNIDVVGTIGDGTNYAENTRLVRNPSVTGPTATYNATEWTSSADISVAGDLGSHTYGTATSAGWKDLTDSGVYSGTNTANLSISDVTGLDSTQFYVSVDDGSGSCNTASNAVLLIEKIESTGAFVWNGGSNSDWNDTNNWETCRVPTRNDDVVIPNVTNDPVVSLANAECRNLSITNGGFLKIETAITLPIYGNLSVESGASIDGVSGTSNLTFTDDGNPSTHITMSVEGSMGTNLEFKVGNAAEVRLAGNINLENPSNELKVLTGGILDFNGYYVHGGGDFRMEEDAEIRITSPDGISADNTKGNIRNTDVIELEPAGGAIFRYTGGAAQQTGSLLPNSDDLHLIIQNTSSAGVELTQQTNILSNGSLQILQGRFIETATAYIDGEGNLTLGGDPAEEAIYETRANSNTGDSNTFLPRLLASTSNTVNILEGAVIELAAASGSQVLWGGVDYRSLRFTGNATYTLESAPNNINGSVAMESGTLDVEGHLFGGVNTSLYMTGGRFRMSGGRTLPDIQGGFNQEGGTIELYESSIPSSMFIRGGLAYFNVELNTGASQEVSIDGGSLSVKAGGSFVVKALATLTLDKNDFISGAGNFLVEADATLLYGAQAGITLGTSSDVTAGNIRLTNGGAGRVAGSFSTGANYGFVGNYGLANDNDPMLSGNALPATVKNLILKKAGGRVNLTQDIEVSENIVIDGLAVGNLYTGPNTITLTSTLGDLVGEDANSHVAGQVRQTKPVPASNAVDFGGLGVTIENSPNSLGDVTVIRTSGTRENRGVVMFDGNQGAAVFWNIEPQTQPSEPLDLTLGWGDYFDNGKDNTTMKVWRSQDGGTTWGFIEDTPQPASGARSASVSADGFSLWTVTDNDSPLPVELMSFSGHWEGGKAVLDWKTASEFNSKGFEVQRSSNGQDFEGIAWVDSYEGNSMEIRKYQLEDAEAPSRAYYRLRQLDLDGGENISKVIYLQRSGKLDLQLLPNPFSGRIALITPQPDKAYDLKVTNISGQALISVSGTAEQLNRHLQQTAQWNTGVYFFQLRSGAEVHTFKRVKQ